MCDTQGDALTESGVAKLADFGLSRVITAHGSAPRPPPSNPPALRNSGSGSLELEPPSGAATPTSLTSSAVLEEEHDDGDLDLTGADDVFIPPRPRGSDEGSSLQALTSSTAGWPGNPSQAMYAGMHASHARYRCTPLRHPPARVLPCMHTSTALSVVSNAADCG